MPFWKRVDESIAAEPAPTKSRKIIAAEGRPFFGVAEAGSTESWKSLAPEGAPTKSGKSIAAEPAPTESRKSIAT
jgi:hypothetical protein